MYANARSTIAIIGTQVSYIYVYICIMYIRWAQYHANRQHMDGATTKLLYIHVYTYATTNIFIIYRERFA